MANRAMTTVSCVLFDLDGTLIDSAPGITECLAETVRAFGGGNLAPESLTRFVGPPVAQTLRALTPVAEDQLPRAVQHYRGLYWARGMQRSTVFPGIRELLDTLHRSGVPVVVATSKRASHARAILELHSLDSYFAAVNGAGEDERGSEKEAVIREALAGLTVAAAAPLMIGDRDFDVLGARAAGIPVLFAGWGYGHERESQGSTLIARDPAHARELVTRLLPTPVLNEGQR